MAAVALGFAALIERSAVLCKVLRWAGIAYLGGLAWEAWSELDDIAPDAARARAGARGDRDLVCVFHDALSGRIGAEVLTRPTGYRTFLARFWGKVRATDCPASRGGP